jgi:hypothetical protein
MKDERLATGDSAAPSNIEEELDPARQQVRYDACQVGQEVLAKRLADAKADVILVVSNPHGVVPAGQQPVFGIYCGDTLPHIVRAGGGIPGARPEGDRPRDDTPPTVTQLPNEPALARWVMDRLVDDGFDMAYSDRFPEGTGIEHSYTVMHDRYIENGVNSVVPVVPFILSRYMPNQATPTRCYAVGESLRRAIESWAEDKRVAIVASGGLSHQIVDEELDRTVVAGLVDQDNDKLFSLSRERLNYAPGTPEILNWIAVAGTFAGTGMTLVDYIPCYRSLAGTGHGVTFGLWEA